MVSLIDLDAAKTVLGFNPLPLVNERHETVRVLMENAGWSVAKLAEEAKVYALGVEQKPGTMATGVYGFIKEDKMLFVTFRWEHLKGKKGKRWACKHFLVVDDKGHAWEWG